MFQIIFRISLLMAPTMLAWTAKADDNDCRLITSDGARVVGGVPGEEEDWPGFMRLEYNGNQFCAATVIDEYWAITAAHCVDDQTAGIRARALNLGQGAKSLKEASPRTLKIEAAFVHPLYDPSSHRDESPDADDGNDIALLKLSSAADMDFATLYGPDDYEYVSSGTCLDVVGWGSTQGVGPDYEDGDRSRVQKIVDELVDQGIIDKKTAASLQMQSSQPRLAGLLLSLLKPPRTPEMERAAEIEEVVETITKQDGFNVAQLPKRDVEECGPAGTGHRGDLSKILCAGFEDGGIDTCQGDSGGPVYYQANRNIYQVGIVSWGIGCANANLPGIYVNTSAYLDWIEDIIDFDTNGKISQDNNVVLAIARAYFTGQDVQGSESKALELLQPGLEEMDEEVLATFMDMCLLTQSKPFRDACEDMKIKLIESGQTTLILMQAEALFWGWGVREDEAAALDILQSVSEVPQAAEMFDGFCDYAWTDTFLNACKG